MSNQRWHWHQGRDDSRISEYFVHVHDIEDDPDDQDHYHEVRIDGDNFTTDWVGLWLADEPYLAELFGRGKDQAYRTLIGEGAVAGPKVADRYADDGVIEEVEL